MTLQQLRYVTAIAETGTLSEAARRFYIAQPSLTASLRELEEELGLTIFRRTNRGAVLTPEGEEFLGYARQVLAQMDLMEEKYLGAAPVKHQFCVSTQHYSFAVEAFVELLREYGGPEYDFRIRETQTYELIEDVALLRSEVGVLYLNKDNETVLRKVIGEHDLQFTPLFTAACICQRVQPAGGQARRHAGRPGPIPAPFLRAGRAQRLLFFRRNFKHPGQQKRHPRQRPRHAVQSAHRPERLYHLQRRHQRVIERAQYRGRAPAGGRCHANRLPDPQAGPAGTVWQTVY